MSFDLPGTRRACAPPTQAHLDEAVSARDSLSRLAEDQQEQIDRLRRRAKRKEEEITKVNGMESCIRTYIRSMPLSLYWFGVDGLALGFRL